MTSVLLIYPFFRRSLDRSRFRFPPLGLAYVAASLRQAGHEVRLLDCTFLRRDEALRLALAAARRRRRHLLHGDDGGRLPLVRRPLRGRCRPAGRRRAAADLRPRRLSRATSTPWCAARASRPWWSSSPRSRPARDLARVPGRRARAGGRRAAARCRRAPSRATSTPCPSPPATCCPTRATSPRPPALRLRGHHRDEHARLPLRLRVLQQRRLRRTPTASARRRTWSTRSRRRSRWATTASRSPTTCSPCERERVLAICDEIERRGLRFAWECLGRVDALRRRDRARDAAGRLLPTSSSASSRAATRSCG